ncbi:transketolase C-terminal domain-containing protein [Bosea sp. (in: a-proteobacteria)]|uniref:transketolase family protein n=1 Tax=Bosea sp. (in: a-proteobacteria) TaxID=1871050 RepID=UPI0026393B4B|nr:transketolase C-terminal domain-containing protein [Bosea sp. (in: a-proteobacteria)]MCO5093376.1 transketolase family protein [Bosea sp. (in: a-proteobacteria)]
MSRGVTLGMGEVERAGGRELVDAPFGNALAALARRRDDIVGLTADLAKYTDILPFKEACPSRFFNVGMAEQNLVAVAAGLAKSGFVAYCTTYGVFATRRAYDFIAIACAHSRAEVKIFAGLPGLTTGYGGTHQAIEDLALMRMVPDLVVIDPCDATELEQVTHAVAAHRGPAYVRLLRGAVPRVLDPETHRFAIGRSYVLREGRDIGLVSTGLMTERALDAAEILSAAGISAGVLHVPTIKPFDAAGVAAFARRHDRLISIENHVVSGGLGALLAEALFEAGIVKPLERVGIPDRFIECGSLPFLQEQCGMTVPQIVALANDKTKRRTP